jgi:hypothetical protein
MLQKQILTWKNLLKKSNTSKLEMLEYGKKQLYNYLGLVIEKFIVKCVALILFFFNP